MSTSMPPIETSFDSYLRKSWFHRNWKWFVPTLMVLGIVCFATTVFSLLMYSFRHSDAFQMAMQKARQSPKVVSALGQTIEPALFVQGSIQISGARGRAQLSIPVSGERGKGTVFIRANKRENRWEPQMLVFENSQSGERTDLLQESVPTIKEQ